MTLYSNTMPHRCAARVMDCFLMEGVPFLFRFEKENIRKKF